jgi:hypothetical protein
VTCPRLATGGLLALVASWTGCIASNVVPTQDRLVTTPLAALHFDPAPGMPLQGLYESVEILGDAALSLRKVYYLFSAGGAYTAAALTEVDGVPSFQTLNGTWQSTAAGLSLDGRPPVLLEQAGQHVRITAENGVLVLRASSLQ